MTMSKLERAYLAALKRVAAALAELSTAAHDLTGEQSEEDNGVDRILWLGEVRRIWRSFALHTAPAQRSQLGASKPPRARGGRGRNRGHGAGHGDGALNAPARGGPAAEEN